MHILSAILLIDLSIHHTFWLALNFRFSHATNSTGQQKINQPSRSIACKLYLSMMVARLRFSPLQPYPSRKSPHVKDLTIICIKRCRLASIQIDSHPVEISDEICRICLRSQNTQTSQLAAASLATKDLLSPDWGQLSLAARNLGRIKATAGRSVGRSFTTEKNHFDQIFLCRRTK
jgi:hypothetical protein